MKGILAILMAGIMVAAMIAPAMGGDAGTSATVGNVAPTVEDKCESPNPVTPDAEGPVTVMKCAIVCDGNGKETISSVTAVTTYPDGVTVKDTETMHVANTSERAACCLSPLPDPSNLTCEVYVGYFTILPCDPKGDYDVAVTVTDGTDSDTMHNTLVVDALVAVTIADMSYGGVAASSIDNPGTHVATNNGNVVIGLDTITSGDMTDVLENTIPATGITCVNPLVQINSSAPPACAGTSADVNFLLDVPAVPTGVYTGITTFTPHEIV